MTKTKYSKDDIILAIQRFYAVNARIPMQKDFTKNPDYPGRSTVVSNFGSWNNAIIAAGLKTTDWSDSDLIKALQEFHSKSNTIPKYNDFVGKFPSARTIELRFGSWNKGLELAGFTTITKYNVRWSDDEIIKAIQDFYNKNKRIPECRDFENSNQYPNYRTVSTRFGTWNNAIVISGLTPNTQNSLGVNTIGLDGHLYRSKAEATFADKFLYNKYDYKIEPKYPNPYNKYYDWFINSLDIYIELDGGIRPIVIEQKKKINNRLNRCCIFVPISIINKYSTLEHLIQAVRYT